MNVQAITWHAITVEPEQLENQKKFITETLGLTLAMEMYGVFVYAMPDGGLLELYTPQTAPDFGFNGSIAFGLRVDDVEAASAEIAAGGGELLGEINRVPDADYAYRHFRGPDGRVYGINESKPQPR